jgi:chromosome segregation ATPase
VEGRQELLDNIDRLTMDCNGLSNRLEVSLTEGCALEERLEGVQRELEAARLLSEELRQKGVQQLTREAFLDSRLEELEAALAQTRSAEETLKKDHGTMKTKFEREIAQLQTANRDLTASR